MKARVPKNRPGIWLYLPQEDAAEKSVRAAAEQCGADFHPIGPEAAGLTVEALLSGSPAGHAEPAELPEPVILMDGLDRKGLDEFLAALRKQCAADGTAPIALKAVVTPTNRGWKFSDLARELAREHEMMKR
jgi:hypothetical protein